ncbi:MAG: ATP-binding protein [Kofleriaceae bacterium]
MTNACRSSGVEHRNEREPELGRVRSIAEEIASSGLSTVVGMRHEVDISTALEFGAAFYNALAQGASAAVAATAARRRLAQHSGEAPQSQLSPHAWLIPEVFEHAPVRIFPRAPTRQRLGDSPNVELHGEGMKVEGIPLAPPEFGYYGGDRTLYALDRAFDSAPCVLLHGSAGSGKSTALVQFAIWRVSTGGIPAGRAVFTRVKRQGIMEPFAEMLKAADPPLPWNIRVFHEFLKRQPMFWFIDDIDDFVGEVGAREQDILHHIIAAVAGTDSRILMTARSDRWPSKADFVTPVGISAIDWNGQQSLLKAMRAGTGPQAVAAWAELLQACDGHPLLTIAVVRHGLVATRGSKAELDELASRVRDGRIALDVEHEPYARRLVASLREQLRRVPGGDVERLAPLQLYRTVVEVRSLEFVVSTVERREVGDGEALALLRWAADVGLLTQSSGEEIFLVHPALPWFLHSQYPRAYPLPHAREPAESGEFSLEYGFALAVALVADRYRRLTLASDRTGLYALNAHAENLCRAISLGAEHGWWALVLSPIHALSEVWGHLGRWADLERVVNATLERFHSAVGSAPPGDLDREWVSLMNLKAQAELARHELGAAEATVRSALALVSDCARARDVRLENERFNAVFLLGRILVQRNDPASIHYLDESLAVASDRGDGWLAATVALNIAQAYKRGCFGPELERAEAYLQRGLSQVGDNTVLKSALLGELGLVAWLRYQASLDAGVPDPHYLDAAQSHTSGALKLTPTTAVPDRATLHQMLGRVAGASGRRVESLRLLHKAHRDFEAAGDVRGAGMVSLDLACGMLELERLEEARSFAQWAIATFSSLGESALELLANAREIEARIDETLPRDRSVVWSLNLRVFKIASDPSPIRAETGTLWISASLRDRARLMLKIDLAYAGDAARALDIMRSVTLSLDDAELGAVRDAWATSLDDQPLHVLPGEDRRREPTSTGYRYVITYVRHAGGFISTNRFEQLSLVLDRPAHLARHLEARLPALKDADEHAVLICDLYNFQSVAEEFIVRGFATEALARAFAERWVVDSFHDFSLDGRSHDDQLLLWNLFGEDAVVIGSGWTASAVLSKLTTGSSEELRDWASLLPPNG